MRRFESFRSCQIQPVLPRSAGRTGQAGHRKPASSGLARFRQAGPCRPRHPDPRRLSMVAIFSAPFTPADALLPTMRGHGYAVLAPDALAALCGAAVADLDTLKPSWDALPPAEYLPDGGSYRRRRPGYFVLADRSEERRVGQEWGR